MAAFRNDLGEDGEIVLRGLMEARKEKETTDWKGETNRKKEN